ncbi:MAG: MmgE/PrpD family protein [Pseudomonadales bacterium]|nr:MmgE/PrpD family protein [Pseudomonadales bacterium]
MLNTRPNPDKVEPALTPAEAYAQWLVNTGSDWSEGALESAHRELIDTVAVMLPGAREPASRIALQSLLAWCGSDAPAQANVVGREGSLPTPWAALVNGTASHALDFDDNFDPPKAHASTVLYPAILAVADTEHLSGQAVLDAYIVGLQIMGRVGQGVNPTHRNRGWHATATVGVFGAAAAAARLLQLTVAQSAHALSLASSLSAGFMSQFGTMAKPLHAGLAAKGGIMAAYFARQGMEAGRHTLDGPHGMNTLMVGPDREELKQGLSGAEHGQTLSFVTENVGEPLLITRYGFRVKRFPNCGSAHRAMDLLLDLMAAHELGADDIREIEVHAPAVHLNNLFYPAPETGLQAKFSMEYALACLLQHGRCGLQDFTDAAVGDALVRRHFPKIRRFPVARLESECPTRLVLHTFSGEHHEALAQMPKGSIAAPFSNAQYWQKYQECVTDLLSASQSDALAAALQAFPTLSASTDMTRLFALTFQG